jgi:nicotinamidase-related amidase
MSHPRMLDRDHSALVVIDVQEAYRGKTIEYERTVHGVRRLIDAAKIVGVPVMATEQYPKGLGHLVPEVRQGMASGDPVIEKLSLSCCGEPVFAAALAALHRTQVVVCGLEAHACVNQTVHDLLTAGWQVHVPYDAISSRFESDYRIGWEKMVGSGAVPSSVELACLEWVRSAASAEFKAVQRLLK